MKARGAVARRVVAVLAAVVLGGCDQPLKSDVEVYGLAAVNGKPLPAAVGDGMVEAVSGTLTLNGDDTFRMDLVSRCNPNPPPGTGCQLNDGGKQTYEGTYSRSEGSLRFGTVVMEARFQRDQALLTFRCTNPESCFPQPFTIEYDFRR